MSKVLADYLGIIPRCQTCLLQVMGSSVHPNRWLVVAATCHHILGANYSVKIAFDPGEDKCFVLYSEEGHADRLERLAIDVNHEELVSFFPYDASCHTPVL